MCRILGSKALQVPRGTTDPITSCSLITIIQCHLLKFSKKNGHIRHSKITLDGRTQPKEWRKKKEESEKINIAEVHSSYDCHCS